MDLRAYLEDALGTCKALAVDIEQTVVDLDVERAAAYRAEWTDYLVKYGGSPLNRMLAVSQMQKAEQVLAKLRDISPNRSEIMTYETRDGWDGPGTALARYTLRRWREPVTAP